MNVDAMHGSMPGRRITDALFVVRMQKECRGKKKLSLCFVNIEKAFGEVPRKVLA